MAISSNFHHFHRLVIIYLEIANPLTDPGQLLRPAEIPLGRVPRAATIIAARRRRTRRQRRSGRRPVFARRR